MLSPEFVVLFHLKTNNCKIESLRSVGIHPQKVKNAIKNLEDIWMIHNQWDWNYWIMENMFDINIDCIEENIKLRKKLTILKFILRQKINSDIKAYEELEYLTDWMDLQKLKEFY